ncbi:MAG: aspartate-semialdehyde dehydrogenase [Clostridia bacterium]
MINCAIVGATGLVGSMVLKVLQERMPAIDSYTLFASTKSKGKQIIFLNNKYIVEELTPSVFDNKRFDYAIFCAGGNISKQYIKIAIENGCRVIDNSSTFRMNKDIPLVIPEINFNTIQKTDKIISNPNCSTIQAALILKPLHDKYTLKRVIVSTYQAVSGAGKKGIDDLINTSQGKKFEKFPYSIYNNCIPQIDTFLENCYTKEEMKIIEETRKILNLNDLAISATAVRVPVMNCHSESINIEFEEEFDIFEVKQLLNLCDGIVVLDDIDKNIYPINTFVDTKDEVFVGRIRRDFSVKNGINLWCVSDNIRKGAATNAVEILEKLINN